MSQTNGAIRIGSFSVDLKQVLGKGATGYVYKGFHADTHEAVAVKAIQMSQVNNQVTQYLLDGQKKAMSTVKSPFVVKTHDIIQHKDYCYIVMELCPNGTLKDYIQNKGKLNCQEALDLFRKIVVGYTAIVDSLFIHRDLKTANILLRPNGDPAIIDFGYCEMIMGKRPMIQYNVGSPSYMAPEAHAKSRYSQKSDIWSLGVILYEMLTGKTIDNGYNIKEFFKIIEAEGKVRLRTEGMTPVCIQLLDMSLQVDPEKRATVHKLKYIIDKSMIPQMQAQLKKTHSQSSKSSSQQQLKFVPPAHFNFLPGKSGEDKQKQKLQKKQKISEHLKFLRSSDKFLFDSQKLLITAPSTPGNQIAYNSNQQKNQQSLFYMPPTQNVPPQHPILRKSLERNQMPPRQMIKKTVSINDVESKLSFKKIPVLQKASSLQCPVPSPYPNREGYTSLRII